MVERLHMEAEDSYEDSITFSIEYDAPGGKKGQLCIAVSEEQAVDSYNELFECTIHLTNAQTVMLRDWLNALPLAEK